MIEENYLLTKPFALFSGATYYPSPGWVDHRGQYESVADAAIDGKKHADDEYGWWQVVDLRTLKIIAGEGTGGPSSANPQ